MADVRSSQPIQSITTSNSVKVSADLNANTVINPIFTSTSDGTNQLDYVVINSAFGATPVAMPVAGKYEATPTTYDDGDAVPILTDANGRAAIDIATQSLTAVAVSKNASSNSASNPIFVEVTTGGASGIEVIDYDTTADVVVSASDNHDYTVTAAKTLKVISISASSAQALKVEVQGGPVAGLVTQEVQFSSGANRNLFFDFSGRLEIPDTSTGTLRIIRKNIGDDTSDVYSTMIGDEV